MKKLPLRALAAVIALAPGPVLAQTFGNLSGHVFDQSGTPIRGVKVVATSPTQIGGAKTSTTDGEGMFRFPGLTPGTFTIIASANKLKKVEQQNVKVLAATTVEVDIVMEVESAAEEVRVVEKAPAINTTNASVGETFDQDFVNSLPLSSRSFQGVASLAAGVRDDGSGNPAIRGGATFNNTYTVDGFQTTDPVTHTFSENFTFDSISQFQVKTAAFGAEKSDTLGGGINIVTKSGSNRFEGDATLTYQDHNMQFFKDARDVGSYRLMVADLSLGGPVIKDRLWFFVSGRGVSNVSTLPYDTQFGQHPSRNILGFTGTAKLTWQVGPRNKITFNTRYEPSNWHNLIQSPLVEPEAEAFRRQNKRVFAGEWNGVLSDSLLIAMRGSLTQDILNQEPQSCRWDPSNCSSIAGEVDLSGVRRRNYTSQVRGMRQTIELAGSVEWFKDTRRLGSHHLKIGSRLLANRYESAVTTPGNAILLVANNAPVSRTETCANDPKDDNGNCHHNWLYSDISGTQLLSYLSEAWKPTRYITITPEVAVHVSRSKDDKGTKVTDAVTATPHLQLAWDPTHDGRTVLRASFNNYVDPGFLALASLSGRQTYSKRCDWDPVSQAYIRNCRSQGGESGTTVGLPCGPDGTNPDGSSCRSKLGLPRVWEYTLGAEREVVTGITVGVDYIYRKFVNQWEDVETNAIWNDGGTSQNRASGWKNGRSQFVFDLQNPAANQRRYHGVTVAARKREGKLRMLLSYTWSRYTGTEDSGYISFYLDNPGQNQYYDGALYGDHRHDLRAQASYQLTSYLTLGIIYDFLSGGPYNRYYYDPSYQNFSAFRTKRGYDTRGTLNIDDDVELRMPDISSLDVHMRLALKQWIKQPIDVFVDVLNIMALRTVDAVFEQDGVNFGRPLSRLSPTTARIGLQYRFR